LHLPTKERHHRPAEARDSAWVWIFKLLWRTLLRVFSGESAKGLTEEVFATQKAGQVTRKKVCIVKLSPKGFTAVDD
jgi:hypothetical protein